MIISSPPVLPFPSFKWRWASYAPTEGLNDPKVFLGVLRALARHEGSQPSSENLLKDLAQIKEETRTSINLVRTPERNLIRNSGQYWKAFDLLESSSPHIVLSNYGRTLASGGITKSEFAATVIATFELPNAVTQGANESLKWISHGIKFKPLELIIRIISKIGEFEISEKFLTKSELVKIVIPLSSVTNNIEDMADTILAYRKSEISIDAWPNSAPDSNDHRMAAEFLLFLEYYGYLVSSDVRKNWDTKYFLHMDGGTILDTLLETPLPTDISSASQIISNSGVADFVERQRTIREVINRPNQGRFRKDVLLLANTQCVVTGTQLSAALEAAHIIPVRDNGSDLPNNGLCMRSDIHTLFDNGHMRIDVRGIIHLSQLAKTDRVYKSLPELIDIPSYVNIENVEWRWNYG